VKPKALLSWSSGKDCAWALHLLRQRGEVEVVGLVTTFNAVDPCGERGEFHTFCHAGPMFDTSIPAFVGETVERDGFWFADLVPGEEVSQ
jgi:diphthamide synthase (EF-2-diphthine--ammonia ligase)